MKKQQMEIALIILLIILMYLQSSLLNTFSKSVLGKGIMIYAIIYITQKFGKNAGILSALIMVLNLHNAKGGVREGFREAQEAKDTNDTKDTKEEKATKKAAKVEAKAQELAEQEPADDLQAYVDGGNQDGLPLPHRQHKASVQQDHYQSSFEIV